MHLQGILSPDCQKAISVIHLIRPRRTAMRLAVYTDFALRLLMYLAVKDDGLATIEEVAESYDISRNHLMKVAHQLGVAGYVTPVRGRYRRLRARRRYPILERLRGADLRLRRGRCNWPVARPDHPGTPAGTALGR